MDNKKLIYASEARRAILRADPKLVHCIDSIPAADAVEVVHARWIWINDKCGCSACRKCLSYDGNGVVLDLSHLPYCPHCGAKMDLEETNNENY